MVEPAGVNVIVGLGSNLQPERHLPMAVDELAGRVDLLAVSSAWATHPVGPPGQPSFVNAAVLFRTGLPPARLKHEVLRDLERRLGRLRTADRFAPRPIDLDVVTYGDGLLELDGREIPEPDLLDHAHLALPASEVAPAWRHPRTGETLAAIAERLVTSLRPSERPRRLPLELRG
jgi:2-amino-4-hydroxy-6-hydroxymethyldihydropteridine diphosphokinase